MKKPVACDIYVGQVEQRYQMRTAIAKSPIQNSCYLSQQGLAGDQCASTKVHGGVERALHHYPKEHYQTLATLYPQQPAFLTELGMGENISSLGMSEDNVHIGDSYRFGEALIQVSQPRSACYKLNLRWGLADLSSVIQAKNLSGWLYRVLEPGEVFSDSELVLVSRVEQSMSIAQVCNVFFHDPLNRDGLEQLVSLQGLSQGWRDKAAQRLATGEVESWKMRLLGPQ